MGSDKFKEVMSATRRNNLLNMVKSQNMMQYVDGNQSNSQLGYGQNDNDYYIDTLQGMNGGEVRDDDSNMISINRV